MNHIHSIKFFKGQLHDLRSVHSWIPFATLSDTNQQCQLKATFSSVSDTDPDPDNVHCGYQTFFDTSGSLYKGQYHCQQLHSAMHLLSLQCGEGQTRLGCTALRRLNSSLQFDSILLLLVPFGYHQALYTGALFHYKSTHLNWNKNLTTHPS